MINRVSWTIHLGLPWLDVFWISRFLRFGFSSPLNSLTIWSGLSNSSCTRDRTLAYIASPRHSWTNSISMADLAIFHLVHTKDLVWQNITGWWHNGEYALSNMWTLPRGYFCCWSNLLYLDYFLFFEYNLYNYSSVIKNKNMISEIASNKISQCASLPWVIKEES